MENKMKNMAIMLALAVAVFDVVGAQIPPAYGYPSPYGNIGYPTMGYGLYPPQPPMPYNPGYNSPGFGGSETANANSNTNVNSNAGGGPAGHWF